MMMTAGFVLTLAGWFAPPITDTVLRVRMAGPVTLLLGFALLIFSYILCAIEQQKCSECCYQCIRAREKENDIRSCDEHSLLKSSNGMHIDHVITQNHVTSPQIPSIPDQIQILQQHLAQLQMNQEALLHTGLGYVYNPLTTAYSLHPNVASGQNTHDLNDHVSSKSQVSSHDKMEAIISKNVHIPYIDEPSSDTLVHIGYESNHNSFDSVMNTFVPQKERIVRLHKSKKGCKHKISKKKLFMKEIHFSNVITNSNAEDFQDYENEIWPQRRHSKKDLSVNLNLHSRSSSMDGNGALHVTDYSQVQDKIKPSDVTLREHGIPNRVSTTERLSFCVPVTPDSEAELTDKPEVLSRHSSFTSQIGLQRNGTKKQKNRQNTGHVIVNIGTSPCTSSESSVDSNNEKSVFTPNNQLDFPKPSSLEGLDPLEYKNTADTKKQKNAISLDLVSHVQVASTNLHNKPITSVKPLPKDLSSLQSPKVLPLKSPKPPIARARIIQKSDSPYDEMAESTV